MARGVAWISVRILFMFNPTVHNVLSSKVVGQRNRLADEAEEVVSWAEIFEKLAPTLCRACSNMLVFLFPPELGIPNPEPDGVTSGNGLEGGVFPDEDDGVPGALQDGPIPEKQSSLEKKTAKISTF
ncbi:unnamed protein product [Dovyalis caffra]|uniref:Uncharacterized protein n=1 Tax=Dovyalis caffra TaxID=77055 RepID=A0AAV1R4K6_9ROSI|nr:unnamed protein product [Dovyalis caffra]